jgi:hypothetical protein
MTVFIELQSVINVIPEIKTNKIPAKIYLTRAQSVCRPIFLRPTKIFKKKQLWPVVICRNLLLGDIFLTFFGQMGW